MKRTNQETLIDYFFDSVNYEHEENDLKLQIKVSPTSKTVSFESIWPESNQRVLGLIIYEHSGFTSQVSVSMDNTSYSELHKIGYPDRVYLSSNRKLYVQENESFPEVTISERFLGINTHYEKVDQNAAYQGNLDPFLTYRNLFLKAFKMLADQKCI